MGVRNDLISVIFAFLQGPMSVRSGRFSVSERIKNSRHSAIQESGCSRGGGICPNFLPYPRGFSMYLSRQLWQMPPGARGSTPRDGRWYPHNNWSWKFRYEPIIKVMLRSILHWTKFPENISKLFLNEKKKKNGTNDIRSHYIGRQRRQRHLNGPYMHT